MSTLFIEHISKPVANQSSWQNKNKTRQQTNKQTNKSKHTGDHFVLKAKENKWFANVDREFTCINFRGAPNTMKIGITCKRNMNDQPEFNLDELKTWILTLQITDWVFFQRQFEAAACKITFFWWANLSKSCECRFIPLFKMVR